MTVFSSPILGLFAAFRGQASSTPALELSGTTVLVTDEHYKHTLGLVRHLGQRGARVDVLAESRRSLACTTRYCHDVVPLKGRDVNSFLDAADGAVSRKRYDIVIPVGYPKTLALAQYRSDFLPRTRIELAPAESIELAANKARMAELAARLGVPTPQTAVPGSLEEADELGKSLCYPVVIRPQRESAGRSVTYAHNKKAFLELCAPYFPPARQTADPPIVQEFIPGYGCGFFATYQNGVCKRIFMHRRIREYPAGGGVSTCAESFYDVDLEAYGRRLLDAMSWHGIAMVEFRRDSRDGQFKLIEVNPKLWGSLDLALAAGADFPGDLCRMALGQELIYTDKYRRDLRYRWPFSISGELYHVKSRPLSFLDTTVDFLNPGVKSNVWLNDLRPNLIEMGLLVRFLASPKSRRG
jgi:predicted ATP-grasp superfamily ATP-dependent carboligase